MTGICFKIRNGSRKTSIQFMPGTIIKKWEDVLENLNIKILFIVPFLSNGGAEESFQFGRAN